MSVATEGDVLTWLGEVRDPEIPAISVVELGVVRGAQVSADGSEVTVTITPTYSGCPAIALMEAEIKQALLQRGFAQVRVVTSFAETWTTNWLNDDTKRKLRESGISPPSHTSPELVSIGRRTTVVCPYCASHDTKLQSEFGSTACKAIYTCRSCLQPFDYFKAI